MRPGIALICLCLVGIQSKTVEILPPTEIKALTGASSGQAYEYSASTDSRLIWPMPCNIFTLITWLMISSGTDDDAKIVELGVPGNMVYVQWPSSGYAKLTHTTGTTCSFNDNTSDVQNVGLGDARILNKWIAFSISFWPVGITVIHRDKSTERHGNCALNENVLLTRDFTARAPVVTSTFNVILK